MNHTLSALLLSEEVLMVGCQFVEHGKVYNYKTMDKNLKVGDLVTVQCTGREHNYDVAIVKVVEVDVEPDFHTHHEFKWVIGKVDMEGLKDLLQQEKDAVNQVKKLERTAKRKQILAALTNAAEETKLCLPSFMRKREAEEEDTSVNISDEASIEDLY